MCSYFIHKYYLVEVVEDDAELAKLLDPSRYVDVAV